jgi:hypothetical protein
MEKKKIQIKSEFPRNFEDDGSSKKYVELPPLLREQLLKKLWIQLNYDLLQVPGYIDEELQQEEPESDNEEEQEKPKPKPITRFPVPKRSRVSPYTGREKAQNPAPPSHSFHPDWVDLNSEIELSLATYTPLVDEKKRMDKGAIVFWARARGNRKDGRPKMFPLPHEKVKLMDLRTGEEVGYGYVSERYFTRKRVMGVIVLRPLIWDPDALIYE